MAPAENLNLEFSPQQLENNLTDLQNNPSPGRMIVMGRSAGNMLVQAYALTGGSDSSKDRKFIEEKNGFKIVAASKTEEEMRDEPNAHLIYYLAMMAERGVNVVSNGAHASPIWKNILSGDPLDTAIKLAGSNGTVDLSSYMEDAPNFTPRIAGVIDTRPDAPTPFGLASTHKHLLAQGSEKDRRIWDPMRDTWKVNDLGSLPIGVGYCIQDSKTRLGSETKPYVIPIGGSAVETTELIWSCLNKEQRVGVAAIDIPIPGRNYHFINRHES